MQNISFQERQSISIRLKGKDKKHISGEFTRTSGKGKSTHIFLLENGKEKSVHIDLIHSISDIENNLIWKKSE